MANASISLPQLGAHHDVYISPTDSILGQVLVFFLPYSGTSSRVDAHIYTACGFSSYSRLTIDPSSNLYLAINHMPIAQQESEAHRALAFVISKYFSELTMGVKTHCLATAGATNAVQVPFDVIHAGDVASKLVKIENENIVNNIIAALKERHVFSIDVDLVLNNKFALDDPEACSRIVGLFGEVQPLPSAKLKRQTSRATRTKTKSIVLPTPNPEVVEQQMAELLNTEFSFVEKIESFFDDFIIPERTRSRERPDRDPSLAALDKLFPKSLDDILKLNSAFLIDLQGVANDGVDKLADVCRTHFPKFKDAYTDYIHMNPAFSELLPKLIKSKTTFAKRVESTGEQRLRSLLIEPVQRLPRYSLFIDAMINNMPIDSHVTLKLIQCRNIISEICELQSSQSTEQSQVATRLSTLIGTWPSSLKSTGRIIAAVDIFEVAHPFTDTSERVSTILILFPNCIAFVRRLRPTSLKAQGLFAEIDHPRPTMGSGNKREVCDLQFAGWIELSRVRFSESDGGRAVWVMFEKELRDFWDNKFGTVGLRKLMLCNSWDGRAMDLLEEIIKARIETKNGGIKELRYSGQKNQLELWTSIYDETSYEKESTKSKVLVRVGAKETDLGDEEKAIEILAGIRIEKAGRIQLEIKGMGKIHFLDTIDESELIGQLNKRLSTTFEKQSQPSHAPLTVGLVETNRRVLQSFQLIQPESESRHRSFRPPSPVKFFSNILGGSSPTHRRGLSRESSILENIPDLPPPRVLERSHSVVYKSEAAEEDVESRMQRITIVEGWGGEEETYHRRLERSFEAFTTGFDAIVTSGTMDTSLLPTRRTCDDTAVTTLVNTLLKDPSAHATAKAASFDILFAAFEKFLRSAWQDSMGSLISLDLLKELNSKNNSLYPGDFEEWFANFLSEMTPQNKRAFKAIIKLLSRMINSLRSLQEKEPLVLAFVELLITSSQRSGSSEALKSAPEFVILIEGLVEDFGRLFSGKLDISILSRETRARDGTGEDRPDSSRSWTGRLKTGFNQAYQTITDPVYRPVTPAESFTSGSTSPKRGKTVIGESGASISTSSSLRKRFGLQSTYADFNTPGSIGKAAASSVWRSLSKKDKDRPGSPTRTPNLLRSKSTDIDTRMGISKRPMSRDRPTVNGLNGTPLGNRSGNAMDTPALATITGSPALGTPGATNSALTTPQQKRRKRRSSLSDLTPVQNSPSARLIVEGPERTPRTLNRADTVKKENKPLTPSPLPNSAMMNRDRPLSKISNASIPVRSREDSPNPFKSENIAPALQKTPSTLSRTRSTESPNSFKSERVAPLNIVKEEKRAFTIAKDEKKDPRFKVQSTQKLRERLSSERQEIAATPSTSFQDELAKIGEELSSIKLSTRAKDITPRITKIETQIAELTKVKSKLAKREAEIIGLDKLYQDVNAENDVLFERFNDELAKLATALRCGEAEKEMLKVLRKTREEEGRLRSENAKLRRENLALKSSSS